LKKSRRIDRFLLYVRGGERAPAVVEELLEPLGADRRLEVLDVAGR
jgi:hypothetical protein